MLTKRERRRGRRPFLLCSVVKMFYSAARSCLDFCKSLHVEVARLKITRHRKIKQKNICV